MFDQTKSDMTMSTNTSISSQVQLDNKSIEEILSSVFNGAIVEEIRYLSYAYTNKTALVRLSGGKTNTVQRSLNEEFPIPIHDLLIFAW